MLKCEQCGYKGKPLTYRAGPHIEAYCASCGKFIKHLSKNEIRVIETEYDYMQPTDCVVIGYDGEVIE